MAKTRLPRRSATSPTSLPVFNGVEATRQISACLPDTEVLIFTMHESDVLLQELLESGARAYLLKFGASRYVVAAVECLANHKPFFLRAACPSSCSRRTWRVVHPEAKKR